jgi:hypothetical protein
VPSFIQYLLAKLGYECSQTRLARLNNFPSQLVSINFNRA